MLQVSKSVQLSFLYFWQLEHTIESKSCKTIGNRLFWKVESYFSLKSLFLHVCALLENDPTTYVAPPGPNSPVSSHIDPFKLQRPRIQFFNPTVSISLALFPFSYAEKSTYIFDASLSTAFANFPRSEARSSDIHIPDPRASAFKFQMCFLLMNHVNLRVLSLQVDDGNTY